MNTGLPAAIINEASIEDTLRKVLGLALVVLAIFVAFKGRKGSIGDAGSVLIIGIIAIVIASLGVLVGTDFGQNVVSALLDT